MTSLRFRVVCFHLINFEPHGCGRCPPSWETSVGTRRSARRARSASEQSRKESRLRLTPPLVPVTAIGGAARSEGHLEDAGLIKSKSTASGGATVEALPFPACL